MQIMQIRVTLNGSKPPIWRRLAVPSDIRLGQLHQVIQIAMGWMDEHLHQFVQRINAPKPTAQELARQVLQGGIDERFFDLMRGERVFGAKNDTLG